MDPMIDLVRDRTADLRRAAEATRRERDLRERGRSVTQIRRSTKATAVTAAIADM